MAWPGRWDAESSITVGKHKDVPGVGCGEGRAVDFCLFVGFFFFRFGLVGFVVWFCCCSLTSVLENAEGLGGALQVAVMLARSCWQQMIEHGAPRGPRLRLQSPAAHGDIGG